MGQEIQSAFAGFSEGPVIGTINAMGVGLGALREAMTETADDFHNIDIQARRAGVGTEWLGKLGAVGQQFDVPIEQLSNGLNILEQRASEAGEGVDKKAVAAFQRLGINAQQLADMADDPQKLFDSVQAGMEKLGTAEERAAVSRQLFGRAGKELIPIFQMTREEFDKSAESIEGLQGSATAANVKMSNDFHNLQLEVTAAMKGIAVELASPVITFISQHKAEIEGDIKSVAAAIKTDLGEAFDYLRAHKDEIEAAFGLVWSDIKAAVPYIKEAGAEVEKLGRGLDSIAQHVGGWGKILSMGGGSFGALGAVHEFLQSSSGNAAPSSSPQPSGWRSGLLGAFEGIESVKNGWDATPSSGTGATGPSASALHIPALDQLRDRIRETVDSVNQMNNKIADFNNAPLASAVGGSAVTPTAAPGNVQQTINVAVAFDPRESTQQFAGKVLPHIRQLKSRLDDQMSGAALVAMARMSMGDEA
jgi:hypothetical protein